MTLLRGRICSRCLYDETVPGIQFDGIGVCNYCHQHDALEAEYPTGAAGQAKLERLVARMKADGKGKPYDCVVGVSGGCDSSYLLYRMVDAGLRPLAAHFDNTWNSPVATQNIYNVLDGLGVELFTLVVNSREYDDLYRAFLLAGVKDIECPTDIGLTATLYRAAEQHSVRYIIDGASFRTEGVAPLGWIYMDGKYIQSVHAAYGTRPLKTFPNLLMGDFLRWAVWRNIKRVRPLYFLDYDKEAAKRMLAADLGWTWYGGHHLENRFTAFWHTYFLPRRYGIDGRLLGHAALVRSGQLSREAGLAEVAELPEVSSEVLLLVQKRLGFTEDELEEVMRLPHRHYSDYKTYKPTFERLRPLFWALYKLDRVPKSFYMKFTRPDPSAPQRQRSPFSATPLVRPATNLHRPD
jgi:N-acetyl sugar amidotransferase